MRIVQFSGLVSLLLLSSCGTPGVDRYSSADTMEKDSVVKDPHPLYDTIVKWDKYGNFSREFRRNDTLLKRVVYENPSSDTEYYPDGCIQFIEDFGRQGDQYQSTYKYYYHKHVLASDARIYSTDGMGGSVQGVDFYDSATGRRTESRYNKDYMPADARDHLDLCGSIYTTRYWPNGRDSSVESVDYHYEGLMYCPCGTWEYYDSTGKKIRTQKFKKCGDGETDCADDTSGVY